MNSRLQSCLFTSLVIGLLFVASLCGSTGITGTVLDCNTHRPIEGAWVTVGAQAQRTNRDGHFHVPQTATNVDVRAIGYSRTRTAVKDGVEISLSPLRVHGLYLSFWGVGSKVLRTGVLDTIERAHLNAMVIDIKGDRGFIALKDGLPIGEVSRFEQNNYHS